MQISKRERLGHYGDHFRSVIREGFAKAMQFHRLELTDSDIEEIFILPEHREQLRTVAPLLAHLSNGQSATPYVRGTYLGREFKAVRLAKGGPFIVPRYAIKDRPVALPPRVTAAFHECEEMVDRWAGEFSMLLQLISYIERERRLTTWEQIRYFFPAITQLISMSSIGMDDKLHDAMRKPTPSPASAPQLPVAFRQACREAGKTISRMRLLHSAPNNSKFDPNCWVISMVPRRTKNVLFPDKLPPWAEHLEFTWG